MDIQQAGIEILGGNPGKFYILCGSEYGVKCKYIDVLTKYYKNNKIETDDVASIISYMSTKHLISPPPSLYVIRYDTSFLSSLNNTTAQMIRSLKISGTVVLIYESDKDNIKCAKYLPEYTVQIDNINSSFIDKYLHSDFPNLPDRYIKIATKYGTDYNNAKIICRCISNADFKDIECLSDYEIGAAFGHKFESTESQFKLGVAARDVNYLYSIIDEYEGDYDTLCYSILSTMLELEKISDNKYTESKFRKYVNIWSKANIYYMFMNVYNSIKLQRSSYSIDSKLNIQYLISLLSFNNIPDPEVLAYGI